ncbi:MAG: hypothetical protein KDE24_06860, partial [Caldilinea sp.]|nr:hypothetical protein [Caldilinea sp.]
MIAPQLTRRFGPMLAGNSLIRFLYSLRATFAPSRLRGYPLIFLSRCAASSSMSSVLQKVKRAIWS